MSEQYLLDRIKADEGLRLLPYDDKTGARFDPGDTLIGKLTIGYGRNLTDNGITKVEAAWLLDHDIDIAKAELDRALPWWRGQDEARQIVLISLVFNMGMPRLLKFKDTLLLLQQKNYDGAAAALQQSLWFEQVGERAVRLRRIVRTGSLDI